MVIIRMFVAMTAMHVLWIFALMVSVYISTLRKEPIVMMMATSAPMMFVTDKVHVLIPVAMVIMPIPVAMTVTLVPWTFALMVFVFLSRQAQVPLAMTIAIYVQMTFVTGKAFATIALP